MHYEPTLIAQVVNEIQYLVLVVSDFWSEKKTVYTVAFTCFPKFLRVCKIRTRNKTNGNCIFLLMTV